MTPEEKKEASKPIKDRYETADAIFFVEAGEKQSKILSEDKLGKKLVFDIVVFPEVSMLTLGKLSRDNRIGYQQDARIAKKAQVRMDAGKSPYSDMRDRLILEDPLHVANAIGKSGKVEKGDPNMTYIAGEPKHVDRMLRAGYKLVKPDEVSVVDGVTKGDRVVLMGDNDHIDNVMMKVPSEDYRKHLQIQGRKSQARLGENVEATKERMGKYGSKVTVYNESSFDTIRPQKG